MSRLWSRVRTSGTYKLSCTGQSYRKFIANRSERATLREIRTAKRITERNLNHSFNLRMTSTEQYSSRPLHSNSIHTQPVMEGIDAMIEHWISLELRPKAESRGECENSQYLNDVSSIDNEYEGLDLPAPKPYFNRSAYRALSQQSGIFTKQIGQQGAIKSHQPQSIHPNTCRKAHNRIIGRMLHTEICDRGLGSGETRHKHVEDFDNLLDAMTTSN